MSKLELKGLKVSYDGRINILEDYNLAIENGTLVSILGPSGCGKTTTLRAIAGFLEPSEGEILIDQEDYSKVPINKRNFGIVFQSYALFPNMTVYENVAYGLKLRKVPVDQREKQVLEILNMVELTPLKGRKPENLSGGQRQRVALARALVISPKLLLLDEPLSNLDAKLRIEMRSQIKKMQQTFKITTILITHDQEECFSISDKVAIMYKGKIKQYDTPENIYSSPHSIFVADFVGFKNLLDVTKIGKGLYRLDNGKEVRAEDVDKAIKIAIRPQNIVIAQKGEALIQGHIKVRTYLGDSYQYEVDSELGDITVNTSAGIALNAGDTIKLNFPESGICVLNN